MESNDRARSLHAGIALDDQAFFVHVFRCETGLPRTPSFTSVRTTFSTKSSGNGISTRGSPSIRMILASSGWMDRKSCLSVCRAISVSDPGWLYFCCTCTTMTNIGVVAQRVDIGGSGLSTLPRGSPGQERGTSCGESYHEHATGTLRNMRVEFNR